jgi:hypothetical protein
MFRLIYLCLPNGAISSLVLFTVQEIVIILFPVLVLAHENNNGPSLHFTRIENQGSAGTVTSGLTTATLYFRCQLTTVSIDIVSFQNGDPEKHIYNRSNIV